MQGNAPDEEHEDPHGQCAARIHEPKRRRIASARFALRMHKDNLDLALKDLERAKIEVHNTLTSLDKAFRGYVRAVEELEALTTKRKTNDPVQPSPPKNV